MNNQNIDSFNGGMNANVLNGDMIQNQNNYLSSENNTHKINIYIKSSNSIIELFSVFDNFKRQIKRIYRCSLNIYEHELKIELNLNNDMTIGIVNRTDKNEHLFSDIQLKDAHILLVNERKRLSKFKEYLITTINNYVYQGIDIPDNEIMYQYLTEQSVQKKGITSNPNNQLDINLTFSETAKDKVTKAYLLDKDTLDDCVQKLDNLCEGKEEIRDDNTMLAIKNITDIANKTALGEIRSNLEDRIISNKKELFFTFEEEKYYSLLEINREYNNILIDINSNYPYFTQKHCNDTSVFICPNGFKSSGLVSKYLPVISASDLFY